MALPVTNGPAAGRMHSVRVEIERSGGVVGLTRKAVVDTGDLEPGQARDAEAALAALTGSGAGAAAPGASRDRFSFRLRLLDGADPGRVVTVEETQLPAALRPLTDQLTPRRRPRP